MGPPSSWPNRRLRLSDLCRLDTVVAAQETALDAATQLPQRDNNAASTAAANASTSRLCDMQDEGEQLGSCLDVSMAILWSLRKEVSEKNPTRLRAWSALQDIASNGLCDSSRDFTSLTCLESNREGTVELVRCRFNRQIYVLKSTTKGAAKRGHRSNAPMSERRLLTLAARKAVRGVSAFTPACVAAFQSQASLHILMEYCPAGDLYHFLDSAGQAPITNEARNPSGGLLRESYVRGYAIDFVAAVSWLHAQNFMHRDIKPGNWLFDRSGHLLLCDLASSAPFATFAEVPASATLPRSSGGVRSACVDQRRVLYRHCCLIGTADYIAPEIFWTADLMSRRKEKQYESTCRSMDATAQGASDSGEEEDDGDDDEEPPPEGPGLYGPECDWWSVGVMMYEMVYKKLPFFADKIADTMEMIKSHHQHFQQDRGVQCSPQLRDLLDRLISDADSRIGSRSSEEVQSHPFFRGVDWSRPWTSPAPFVPQVDSLNAAVGGSGESSEQPEISVLHSPRVDASQGIQSFDAGPANWSKMWADGADQFPAFPNSVEHSRLAHSRGQMQADEESDKSDDTLVSEHSLASQWSDFDPTWIGFTYVPNDAAFEAERDTTGKYAIPLPSSSPDAKIDSSSIFLSEEADAVQPMASTPFPVTKMSSYGVELDLERSSRKPPPASLHRHAIQTATRLRASSSGFNDGRFVTPMRKPSYSTIHFSALEEDGERKLGGPPVPPSPYPFPIATVARPRRTPFHPSTALRRNDLDRARSASATSGEGSDSRCSGGSNAKRDISEREAWHELKIAVMQSARKGQRPGRLEAGSDEEGEAEGMESGGSAERNGGSRFVDDSHIPAAGVLRRAQREGGEGSRKRVTFHQQPETTQPRAPIAKRPELARLLSDEHDRKPLEPILDLTPPHLAHSSSTSSSPTASMHSVSPPVSPGIEALHRYSMSSATPSASRPALGKKKSARQLLLKAQHRDTPTRIARTASPLLIEPFSATAVEGAGSGMGKGRSHSARVIERSGGDMFERRTASYGDAEAALAMPLPSAVVKLKSMNSRLMRRRDSHEMLSQYRQGINPDESAVASVKLRDDHGAELKGPASMGRRPSSLTIRTAGPATTRISEGSLSSPSFPMFPDAFTETREEGGRLQGRRLAKASSHAALPRNTASLHQEPSAVRLNRSHEPPAPPPLPRSQHVLTAQNTNIDVSKTQPLSSSHKAPISEAMLRPESRRPSLMKRASSYLASVGAKENRPVDEVARQLEQGKSARTLHDQKPRGETARELPPRRSPLSDGLRQGSVGNLSRRYERLQVHIHQVENHLERLKARLQTEP